jgi:hypothetical protein
MIDDGVRLPYPIDDEDIRAHYLNEVHRLTRAVPLDKLTTAELVSLVAILIPPHSRVLDATVPKAAVLPFRPRGKKRNVST